MKHNNKLLSILLLSSIAASIFATTLSIGKDRYMEAKADVTYKTIYLYTPSPVAKYNDADPEKEVTWDAAGADVRIYTNQTTLYPLPGIPMQKVEDHLYTFTLRNDTQSLFVFTTTINEVMYRSHDEGISNMRFNDIGANNKMTLNYYAVTSRDAAVSKVPYTVNTAEQFARTFLAVLHGTCDNEGVNTDMTKLSSVWNEMKALFTAAAFEGEELNLLKNAKRSDSDIYGDFARLYDLIYSKYSATVGNNFVNRNIAQLAVANITPSITNRNNINMIVAISIGATSIAIVSIYFFIRKRKEK